MWTRASCGTFWRSIPPAARDPATNGTAAFLKLNLSEIVIFFVSLSVNFQVPDGVLLPEQVGHGRAHGGREDFLRRGRGGGIHHTGLEFFLSRANSLFFKEQNRT